jgi:hypothetical protein
MTSTSYNNSQTNSDSNNPQENRMEIETENNFSKNIFSEGSIKSLHQDEVNERTKIENLVLRFSAGGKSLTAKSWNLVNNMETIEILLLGEMNSINFLIDQLFSEEMASQIIISMAPDLIQDPSLNHIKRGRLLRQYIQAEDGNGSRSNLIKALGLAINTWEGGPGGGISFPTDQLVSWLGDIQALDLDLLSQNQKRSAEVGKMLVSKLEQLGYKLPETSAEGLGTLETAPLFHIPRLLLPCWLLQQITREMKWRAEQWVLSQVIFRPVYQH